MSHSLRGLTILGRRGYSSTVTFKKTFTPKANASSYARKTTTTSRVKPASSADASSQVENTGAFLEPGTSSSYSAPSKSSSLSNGEKTFREIFPVALDDSPDYAYKEENEINWSSSFSGLGSAPFPSHSQEVLAQPLDPKDVEMKPDGIIFLPEIKYRRILNRAFGAGGWGLVPRSETVVTGSSVTREYALICLGRLVSIARGEQDYFSQAGIPTATEGCKSNALMRCCKDLGIASELWDPYFIKEFKAKYCEDKFVEHVTTKKVRKIWKRKDRGIEYPYKLKA